MSDKDRIEEGAVERWNHAGLECALRPSPVGPLNGYVRLPEGHPMRGAFYDDFDVSVHGGLTYGCDEFGWIGFDTLHLGDWWHEEDVSLDEARKAFDAEMKRKHNIEPTWSEERGKGFPPWTRGRLRDEVNQLADQVGAWPSTLAVLAEDVKQEPSERNGGFDRA